ncbi:MAG: SAM-dependent methyltransferase [Candidatus Marinimicrobia bacterium]|nr:SAM-dependent methyltransferase [Candidatus Neomarinimicrobiota bacterium]|tara:strand:+ start:131 stop:796 length:666 start_codon:yes stop_codon:yes gene_type:complete
MGNRRYLINKLHNSTKRNYIERMMNNKAKCIRVANKFGYDYWDGNRKFGYGGYKYIKDYWKPVAKKIIKIYSLNNKSKVLDLGCGKGFLIYEIKKILPKIKVIGIDISAYAIKNSKKEIKKHLIKYDARKKLPFKSKYFDLVISLGTLHNFEIFDLYRCLDEIERVGVKKYIMVESFRNSNELFNLQCWALTCKSFFSANEWKWIFRKNKFNGDFEFIFFK